MNTNTIQLQLLQKEYDALLNQYQATYKAYTDHKKEPNIFVSLKNKSWWGTSSITDEVVSDEAACVANCSTNDECSGATFDPKNNYCWIRSGPGTLSSNPNTIAIVNRLQDDIRVLKTLNTKLLDVTDQISKITIANEPNVLALGSEENKMKEILTKEMKNLDDEEKKLRKINNEHETLEESYNYQTKYVDQQNIIFKILLFFAIFILTAVMQKIEPSWKYIGYVVLIVSVGIMLM